MDKASTVKWLAAQSPEMTYEIRLAYADFIRVPIDSVPRRLTSDLELHWVWRQFRHEIEYESGQK